MKRPPTIINKTKISKELSVNFEQSKNYIISETKTVEMEMKYHTAVFIIFSVFVASSRSLVSAGPIQQLGLTKSFHLGDLLRNPVVALVQTLVQFLSLLILQLVPANTEVQVAALISAVECLKTPSVATVLTAVLSLAKVKENTILAILPRVALNVPINIGQLKNILASKIGAASSVPFSILLSLLGTVLLELISNELIGLLNGLS